MFSETESKTTVWVWNTLNWTDMIVSKPVLDKEAKGWNTFIGL